MISKYGKGAVVQNARVFGPVYYVAHQSLTLKHEFLEICLITFCGVSDFGTTSAMRVIFFWKCSKFNVYFRNGEKN